MGVPLFALFGFVWHNHHSIEKSKLQAKKHHSKELHLFETALLLRCPADAAPDKAGLHPADRCHSLGSLFPPPAAVASLPKFELASPVQITNNDKKSATPNGMTDFLELLARFELATSSLPKVHFREISSKMA